MNVHFLAVISLFIVQEWKKMCIKLSLKSKTKGVENVYERILCCINR